MSEISYRLRGKEHISNFIKDKQEQRIYTETCMWHDKNIQSNALYR